MHTTPRFGAGIWHFATYVDRYASDGYGPARTTLDAIELAGQVDDLVVRSPGAAARWSSPTTRAARRRS